MIRRARLTIVLDPETIKVLKLIAIEREVSASDLCSAAINDYLCKHKHLIPDPVIAEQGRKRLKEKGKTNEEIREIENKTKPF